MSMVQDRCCVTVSLASPTAVELSTRVGVGGWGWPSSSSVVQSRVACLVLWKRALNSASAADDTIPTRNGRELGEKWVSELKDKFLGPNWQRMLSCAYTTQLLHSTGEVCWNNRDSYFIWFEFVC